MSRHLSFGLATAALLAAVLAGSPAKASSDCQAYGPAATQSCTFKLAGTSIYVSGGIGYPALQPTASIVVKVISVTTGAELLRCEATTANAYGNGCSDGIFIEPVHAGLPPTESLKCDVSGSGTPSYSTLYCGSGS